MLNTFSRRWLVGAWCAAVAVLIAVGIVMGASPWTGGFILLLAMTPAIILLFIGGGAVSPTVAEILHSVDSKDARR